MANVLEFLIGRARTVISTLVFLLVAGALAYSRIPKEAEPELQLPLVQISVRLEGISPIDAERLLIRPLEEQVRNLEGLEEIRATAFQGGATVILEFDSGTDIDLAEQEVRTEVDQARPEMPADIDEPEVKEIDLSWAPVLVAALSGDISERQLLKSAREYRDRVRALPGVLDVVIVGAREEVVEVVLDSAKAQSYRLNTDDLAQVFSRANRLVAAGRIDTGQGSFSVSLPGLFERVEDILALPVKVQGNAVVRVRDIAEIRRTFKDPDSFVRIDGERAVTIEVKKRIGGNLIETALESRAILDELREKWPSGLKVQVIQDQSLKIGERLQSLQNSVLLAVFLVMAVVIAALGLRSGLLVGVAIPGAFLTGILTLALMDLTINVTVMFGLIIAVGLLVDGAIVVTEFADRKMAERINRRRAYLMSAERMSWPIISSTATTIAAFVPLLFWPGVTGQLMGYLPITLICVLTGSLLMALVFVPTLGSLFGRPGDTDFATMWLVETGDAKALGRLGGGTGFYVRLLTKALSHPGKIVMATVALLVGVQIVYLFAGNSIVFFPREEAERSRIIVHARGNLSASEKDILIKQIEDRILGIAGVETLYSRTDAGAEATDDVIGQITLDYVPWDERRKSSDILADVLVRTKNMPGVRLDFEEQRAGGGAEKPIQIELSSVDLPALNKAVDHVRRGLSEIGGFRNVEDTRPLPGIEWRLEIDRAQAARFGADLTSVGNAVRLVTNGLRLGSYRPDDSEDELDILVRYPATERSVNRLDDLRIETRNGLIPISNFIKRVPIQQNTEISRVDSRRVLTVEADVEPGLLPYPMVGKLRAWLARNPIESNVTSTFRGEQQEGQENGSFLGSAFAIALCLMAGILLLQFNSFYHVFLILSSVILSTIGVMLGHLITGQPFSVIMSGIGVIALAGIVVNNNIVLIDTYQRVARTVPDAYLAVLQTSAQRLRPVCLTTATTVLGLLPMAFMVSIDFFTRSVTVGAPATMWWGTLAMTIVSGLIFATFLTLVVTPCALLMYDNWQDRRSTEQTPLGDVNGKTPIPAE